MTFGERLSSLRKENNLTQEEIASLLSMNRGTYAQYEINRRHPDFETLKKIAKFFNVNTDYLIGLTDTPQREVSCIKQEKELQQTVFSKRLKELRNGKEWKDFRGHIIYFLTRLELENIEKRKTEEDALWKSISE